MAGDDTASESDPAESGQSESASNREAVTRQSKDDQFVANEGTSNPELLLTLMVQAVGACAFSGVNSLFRVGFSWLGYASVLAQQLRTIARTRDLNDDALRILLDESIAQLRNLGDMSVQEARVLQKNLTDLAKRLRELDNRTVEHPQRYARAKR